MPAITVRPNQPLDKVLRIFKKQCEKAGIIADARKHTAYEKPSIKKRKKSEAARKRAQKQRRKMGLI